MKKLLFSLALVTGMIAASPAQTAPGPKGTKKEMKNASPEEKAKKGTEHAAKKLGLTDDQKPKWEAAALTRIKANEPHRDRLKGSTTPEERKEIHKQVRANNEAFDKSVNEFLTADQKTKWEAEKKERREKRLKKMGGNGNADEIDVHEED